MATRLESGDLLTVREAAAVLRVTPQTVLARVRDGSLRAGKVGRSSNSPLRIPRAELARLLDLEGRE